MKLGRRAALQVLTTGAAGAALSRGVSASEKPVEAPVDAVGMLYDATLCIGCKACEVACSRANGLPPDPGASGGLYQAPRSLNAQTKNIIKVFVTDRGHTRSFMKQQCMHCIDPACVSGCPMKALHKGLRGIVEWDGTTCIGCRYCQIACPYNIPKFEWAVVNPKIVKCELCRHRLVDGLIPACCEVCPVHAVIFGTRQQLLAEAKRRIAENPGRYFEDRVYGEHEGGGTQVFYLSHVPFHDLGLPKLSDRSLASGVRTVQRTVYQGFVTPVLAYGVIASIMKKRMRSFQEHAEEAQERTGLGEQL